MLHITLCFIIKQCKALETHGCRSFVIGFREGKAHLAASSDILKNLDKALIRRIHKQLFSTRTTRTGREKDTEQQQCEWLYIT